MAKPYEYPFVDYWSAAEVRARDARARTFAVTPAPDRDVAAARAIIDSAPHGPPLAIMEYFADLVAVGSTGEPFNSRWQKYENPVIVWFFHATNTVPTGDCTSWCAAFLSWCLEHSGIRSKHSASSQAYRDFADEADAPRRGDIVVFQNVGDSTLGHVALYLEENADRVRVIGGNQAAHGPRIPSCPPGFSTTTICREWRAKRDEHQFVLTYRRYT